MSMHSHPKNKWKIFVRSQIFPKDVNATREGKNLMNQSFTEPIYRQVNVPVLLKPLN